MVIGTIQTALHRSKRAAWLPSSRSTLGPIHTPTVVVTMVTILKSVPMGTQYHIFAVIFLLGIHFLDGVRAAGLGEDVAGVGDVVNPAFTGFLHTARRDEVNCF